MPATGVYYEIATARLDAQMQRVDQLDAKVATAYASASGILAIMAGLLSLSSLPSNQAIRTTVFALLILAGLVYIALAINLFFAYRVSEWSLRPDMETLQANCTEYDEDVMREWVADECVRSMRYNEPLIAIKARWLYLALIALAVEALLLSVAGAVTLLSK